MEKLYTVSKKKRLRADCGSDHELLIAIFGLNDYTVEVTNRFKGLHLIDRVPEELWMEVHDIV